MGRPQRIVSLDYPLHIYQRGINRSDVFWEPDDYRLYLKLLRETKEKIPVKVFSFCLMTNHVHLILQPVEKVSFISLFMQTLTSNYSTQFNGLKGRSGFLWGGRFKSSLIETDCYLLSCSRYVEMNPVEAGIVLKPEDYPWSSFNHKIGKEDLPWLDSDPCFLGLGESQEKRAKAYHRMFMGPKDFVETRLIRNSIKREYVTGTIDFKESLGKIPGLIKRKRY